MTDPAPTPIIVNGDPLIDQVGSGLRLLLGAVGAVLLALGYTKAAGAASSLLLAVGPVALFVAFVLSQIKARTISRKAATMARMLPDDKAQAK